MTINIIVRNTDDGQLAVHGVYNQDDIWTEEQAREWAANHELAPWVYHSHDATA